MQTPTASSAVLLLPALKRALEGIASQHELMKEMVAAVQDSERGKPSSLQILLQEVQDKNAAQRLSPDEHEQLKQEVCWSSNEERMLP